MTTAITLDGKLYHAGIAGDPIIILTVFDENPFELWCRRNGVFTQIMRHPDPSSGHERAVIYVTEQAVMGMSNGTAVRVTVEVREEKRGKGIRVVGVEAS